MTTNIERLTEAANFLIASPDYAKLANEMTTIIERWHSHPMVYGQKLDVLNSVVDLGLANRDAFEALLKFVQKKRAQLPQAKRQDYQRELMRQRRGRLAKAVALREAEYGPMTAHRKKEYTKEVQARWAREREEFLKARGKLTWEQRNDAIAAFWQGIDNRLDVNLRHARSRHNMAVC